DDDAALAAMPGRHPLHGLACAENAAGDIDRQHFLDALGRHLVDAHTALADDAGIVDEGAERSELVGRLEQPENIALLADVALHRDRLAVLRLDVGDDFLCRGLIRGIAHDDPIAARSGSERSSAADAAAATGYDYNPIRHVSPHPSTHTLFRLNARRGAAFRWQQYIRDPAPAAPGLPDFP